ncbi:MAG: hypothetical protein B6V02_01055 [Thermoprotei archaeon ex4572_64]|nr:MAG: hypothetical protein B6V02_01055 [Thermoprotei archaeon ex4572_64]
MIRDLVDKNLLKGRILHITIIILIMLSIVLTFIDSKLSVITQSVSIIFIIYIIFSEIKSLRRVYHEDVEKTLNYYLYHYYSYIQNIINDVEYLKAIVTNLSMTYPQYSQACEKVSERNERREECNETKIEKEGEIENRRESISILKAESGSESVGEVNVKRSPQSEVMETLIEISNLLDQILKELRKLKEEKVNVKKSLKA